MQLKDHCHDWHMSYEGPDIPDFSEVEIEHLKAMMHITGDALSLLSVVDDTKARYKMAREFLHLFMALRNDIDATAQDVVMEAVHNAPFAPPFEEEELFGGPLQQQLMNKLTALDAVSEFDEIISEAFHQSTEPPDPPEATLDEDGGPHIP